MAVVRYLLSLFVLFSLAVAGFANPLHEGFEGPFAPPNWQTFETGDGASLWTRSTRIDVDWGYSAYARSESVPTGMAIRQWLVTPRLAPDSAHSSFTFFARTQYPVQNGDDTLYVKLSTTGNGSADFSHLLLALKPGIGRDIGFSFTPFSINLQAYIGSPVYLAFERVDWGGGNNSIYIDSVGGPESVIPLAAADNPHPVDHAVDVSVTTPLLWSNQPGTQSVDLYFSRVQADVEVQSTAARVLSGLNVEQYIPASNLLSETTYFWRVVSRNSWDRLPGPVWQFSTGSGGLGGDYLVGSGGDFASLSEAMTALTITGVAEPTVLKIMNGTYPGMLTLPAIPGASSFVTITLARADSNGAVTLQSNGTTDSCALLFNGANYFTIDGLNISAAGGNAKHAVSMASNSHSNQLRNCTLRGPGLSVMGSDALHLQGTGCDSNRFENITVRSAIRGFHMEGNGSAGVGNQIINCRTDSVRCGIFVTRQDRCTLQGNDISVNGGASDEVDGILLSTTLPGDTVIIRDNAVHNIATSGVYAVGIRLKPDSTAAVVRVFNNFIFGFQNTGSSQVRAIYASSGQLEIASNSICVNNVSATGAAYAFYSSAVGNTATLHLYNNLFVNREATSSAYNLFFQSNTVALSSDYNIFFGNGSGYRMGRWGTDAVTLSQWRGIVSADAHSLEGDPGFQTDTNLHLSPANGLAHQNGWPLPYITSDVDGDSRLIPPDRGADEYTFNAPAADFAVLDVAASISTLPELTDISIPVVVQNRGSATQSNVPLRLFFNGFQQALSYVSLSALETDTVSMSWTTPASPAAGSLRAQVYLSGDAVATNDSLSFAVQIVRQPMSGSYSVGGIQPDYSSLSAAIADLQIRGVSGPVTLGVRPGYYSEQVILPDIPGTSAFNTLTVQRSDTSGSVTFAASTAPATLVFSGARHVIWNGIDLGVAGSNYTGLLIQQNSDSNTFTNFMLTGSSLTATTACGVHTSGGDNDYNTFQRLTVSGFYYGIRLEGIQGLPDRGNRISHCTVLTSRLGLRADYQNDALIISNRVQTGYPGAASVCRGIHVGSLDAGCLVTVDRNNLTGGQGNTGACGIYVSCGAGTANIQNNFISGWLLTGNGPLYGILAGSGTANVSFNSLWMNDIAATGNVAGIADSGSTTVLNARNNVIQVSETTNPVWGILRTGGTLSSDYNCLNNLAPQNSLYRAGRSGNTDYSTLTEWTTGTGQDIHSLWGNPGFVDSLNLHISPENNLLNGQGITQNGITSDYDGDVRSDPPDIGADEYLQSEAAADFAVAWAGLPPAFVTSQSSYAISIRVSNSGTQAQVNVPIRLFFNRAQIEEQQISLAVGGSQTVTMRWNTPPAELDSGILQAQCFLPGDFISQNDSVTARVTIIGPPLEGTYDIGGGNQDFEDPVQAATHLRLRGISGLVEINTFPGLYSGAVYLPDVTGTSGQNRIVFHAVDPDPSHTVWSAVDGNAVVRLDGVDYLTLNGLTLQAMGSCTTAVDMRNGASNNTIQSCSIIGSDSASSATIGVRIQTDANNFNNLDTLWVRGAFTGVAFDGGPAGTQSADNRLHASSIYHARYGVTISRQLRCQITANDIQPGSLQPAAAACYGVYVSALGAGGEATISGNRIHGFTDVSGSAFNRAVGVFAAGASGASVAILNNFIYDFAHAGLLKINGIYLSSGTNLVLHNSVSIADMPASTEIAAIYISTAGSHQIINNILLSMDSTNASYGIWQASGGGLFSDGNDLWGPSFQFVTGRIGAVNYPSLSAWRLAGYDSQGISADPGFVSSQDLHISPSAIAVNDRGIYTALVTTDIDGQLRDNPPDLGADEYEPQGGPEPVTNLRIVSNGDSITLIWNRTTGAASYRIYFDSAISGVGSSSVQTADTTYSEAAISGAGIRFYYVKAESDSLPSSMRSLPPALH